MTTIVLPLIVNLRSSGFPSKSKIGFGILQYDTLSDTWFHINPEAFKMCKVVGGKRTEPYYETIEISDYIQVSKVNREKNHGEVS